MKKRWSILLIFFFCFAIFWKQIFLFTASQAVRLISWKEGVEVTYDAIRLLDKKIFFQNLSVKKQEKENSFSGTIEELFLFFSWNEGWKINVDIKKTDIFLDLNSRPSFSPSQNNRLGEVRIDKGSCRISSPQGTFSFLFSYDGKEGTLQPNNGGEIIFSLGKREDEYLLKGRGDRCSLQEISTLASFFSSKIPEAYGTLFFQFELDKKKSLSFSSQVKDLSFSSIIGKMDFDWASLSCSVPLSEEICFSDIEIYTDFSNGRFKEIKKIDGFFSSRPNVGIKSEIRADDQENSLTCTVRGFEKDNVYEWIELRCNFLQEEEIYCLLKEEKELTWDIRMQKKGIALLQTIFSSLTKKWDLSHVDAESFFLAGRYIIASNQWEAEGSVDNGTLTAPYFSCDKLYLPKWEAEGENFWPTLGKGAIKAEKITLFSTDISSIQGEVDFSPEQVQGEITATFRQTPLTLSLGKEERNITVEVELSGPLKELQSLLCQQESWEGEQSSSILLSLDPKNKNYSARGKIEDKKGGAFYFTYENKLFFPLQEGQVTAQFEKIQTGYLGFLFPFQLDKGEMAGRLCLSQQRWTIQAEGIRPSISKGPFLLEGIEEKRWFLTALYDQLKKSWHADLYIPESLFSEKNQEVSFLAKNITFTWDHDRLFIRSEQLQREDLLFSLEGAILPKEEEMSFSFLEMKGEIKPLLSLIPGDFSNYTCNVQGEGKILFRQGRCEDFLFFGDLHDGTILTSKGMLENISGVVEIKVSEKRYSLLDGKASWKEGKESYILSFPKVDFFQEKGIADLSISHSFLDIIRLQLQIEKNKEGWKIDLLPDGSYLFQHPLSEGSLFISEKGEIISTHLQAKCDLSLCSLHLYPFFPDYIQKKCRGDLLLQIEDDTFHLSIPTFFWKGYSFEDLSIRAEKQNDLWEVNGKSKEGYFLSFFLKNGAKGFEIENGMFGEMDKWNGHFSLSQKEDRSFYGMLSSFSFAPSTYFEGEVKGKGFYSLSLADRSFALDLDVEPLSVKRKELEVKNVTPIHLHYDNTNGCQLSGIKCTADHPEMDLANFHFEAETVCFLPNQKKIDGKKMEGIIPPSLLIYLSQEVPSLSILDKITKELSLSSYIELEGEMSFSSDPFSYSLSLAEVLLPIKGNNYKCQDLHIKGTGDNCTIDGHFPIRDQECHFTNSISLKDKISGDLYLSDQLSSQNPLHIEWRYQGEKLEVERIIGSFLGLRADLVESSFEEGVFLGSIGIDFSKSKPLLPEDVALAADFLQLGKGFELKGKWDVKERGTFKGLFTGKNCSILGFTFKTLMSQVNFSKEELVWFDFKLSDSCGIIKSDYIQLSQKQEDWQISIPIITMHEFRPSLLQKEGEKKGVLDPFLIRELQLHKLQGTIGDERSFSGSGSFHFINSFKRGQTLLDIPSEFLGRIFGLDLELLIPVRGDVQYHIQDGTVAFTDLSDSFSENQRSEFFFLREHPPSMDLKGNLSIHIGMKHYVLFTFTENFIISVEGKLLDPAFRLKRKKAFSL